MVISVFVVSVGVISKLRKDVASCTRPRDVTDIYMIYIYVHNYNEHWVLARDVPSTSPSHGGNSGAHGEPYSKHICGFSTFMSHILAQRASHRIRKRNYKFAWQAAGWWVVALVRGEKRAVLLIHNLIITP